MGISASARIIKSNLQSHHISSGTSKILSRFQFVVEAIGFASKSLLFYTYGAGISSKKKTGAYLSHRKEKFLALDKLFNTH